MNIKRATDYTIGLDLGTGSVGWAVTDKDGELYHRNGMPTLGVRLFPSAKTAAETRAKRGQRRRYNRRRQRIEYLQTFFFDEVAKVDPDFFARIRQSALIASDRGSEFGSDTKHALFNGSDFTEKSYYDSYPTIWHLRRHLATTNEKADIRLIYLALHNIVKCRGNFLREDERGITAANANASKAVEKLTLALGEYTEDHAEAELSFSPDEHSLISALDAKGLRTADRAEKIQKALHANDVKRARLLARACVGYKVEFSGLFVGLEKGESTNLAVNEDDKVDAFLSICPDDALSVFEAIQAIYSSYVLSSILRGALSLSEAMMRSYEQHHEDLRVVKALIREYLGDSAYRKMFRGPKTADGEYDINKLPKGSYTAYIAGEKLANKKGCSYEDFIKNLRKVLHSSKAIVEDERYQKIQERLNSDDGDFLAKQKTRANGAIPFQLHLEEMAAILENQGKHYPFLLERKTELEKLVSSRIPYYVGPLNAGRDPEGYYPSNNVDHTRKFAWSVRREGMEHAKAYPWNVEEVIDIDKTAELFIRRMTGTCTYLYGEPVLPRCSLLYEEFCVLNELNSAKWCEAGRDPHRFDWADREEIIRDLFMRKKSVTHRMVADWLREHETVMDPVISGTQGEHGFESKLNSYNDFCKILRVRRLDDEACPLTLFDIEQIILWNTVFEDRSILKRKLEQNYGDVLSESQIRQIMKKRYTGWGRLSEKLLTGIKVETILGPMSIMSIMRHGDPIAGHHRQAMNLMEILREKRYGFEERIDEINREHMDGRNLSLSIEDMPGSPALRRSVNQAMRIIDEIVSLTGCEPSRICIEVTRDDDLKKKGKRTNTRFQKLNDAMQLLKKDAGDFDQDLLKELKGYKNALDNERLVLYFMQGGKSLYSGKPLDINRLSEYEVDHIIPRCYIKDDSFDNKALVLKSENQRKLDSLLLDDNIIRAQRAWWSSLNRAGLISDKKMKNLTCTCLSDRMLQGFINRQLVETGQIVKFVRQMCEAKYPDARVISVRPSLGHDLRDECGLVKCREFNDYHHAHDAYIACEMARFIDYRYPKWQDGFDLNIIRNYAKKLAGGFSASGRLPGRSGFIVNSFVRAGFDKETGEVYWDADAVIGRIRKVMGYKKIFLTRMLEEQTGALWKETVYSPRDSSMGKNLAMPLKGFGTAYELNPRHYGGYTRVQQAYFFIFRAKDHGGKWKDFFEGVPIHLLDRLAKDKNGLLAYADSIAIEKGCHDVQILRNKVAYRQKFELNGSALCLFGKDGASNEVRPASQISAGTDIIRLAKQAIFQPESLKRTKRRVLTSYMLSQIEVASPLLAATLGLNASKEDIELLDAEQYGKLLLQVCSGLRARVQKYDLSALGKGTKKSSRIALASKLKDITWIDESVTGMYVRRTTYEDMIHGL